MINQNCQSITNSSLLKEITPQTAFKSSFSSFITFGDSLADVGNIYITTRSTNPPSPPYADGRFSNGELVPEIIAKELGLSASTPSLAGGDNYAFGTAETGSGFSDEGLPNVGEQIKAYLSIDAPAAGDIFFITAGSNNFFPDINEEITPDNIATPTSVLEGLIENITTLADAGAENFIIPN
ncbi:MAG: SGNH/GDSL hydrolase family protein, partial [Rivularia sp. (in: cyanobacteria)]